MAADWYSEEINRKEANDLTRYSNIQYIAGRSWRVTEWDQDFLRLKKCFYWERTFHHYNKYDDKGYTILHTLVDGRSSADVFDRDYLVHVIPHQREKLLKAWLQHKAVDVNAREEHDRQRTPLQLLLNNYPAKYAAVMLQELLTHPAIDVNCKCLFSGARPLHEVLTCYDQDFEQPLVKLLLAHPKIDVNAWDNNGQTAFSSRDGIISSRQLLLNTAKTTGVKPQLNQAHWNPVLHPFLGQKYHCKVICILMCFQRYKIKLPEEIVLEILSLPPCLDVLDITAAFPRIQYY